MPGGARCLQVRHSVTLVNQDPPATCSPDITAAVANAAAALGLSTKRMVSRAYHDSLFMARWVQHGARGASVEP